MDSSYEIVQLHNSPHLLEKAALLLNTEWDRSLEARKHSIEESKEELPLSLLLVLNNEDVIGFVRISPVANRKGALIESLIILANMRRCGLGRYLMEAAESHVKKLGYETMHLSTHDQHMFYKRIGYRESEPVNAIRKCNAKIHNTLSDDEETEDSGTGMMETQNDVEREEIEECQVDDKFNHTSSDSSQEKVDLKEKLPSLPPPPPPPPPLSVVPIDENTLTKWYIKTLI